MRDHVADGRRATHNRRDDRKPDETRRDPNRREPWQRRGKRGAYKIQLSGQIDEGTAVKGLHELSRLPGTNIHTGMEALVEAAAPQNPG